MPASPSSSAQRARAAVAARLREIRQEAGLTGRELAALCGWHPAKNSRIENGKAAVSDADIRVWCTACGADDQALDLIAASRTADQMYVAWRRLHRTGLRRLQESYVPLFERTHRFRIYCSRVVPGFIQTEEYATALLTIIADFRQAPNDVSDAVQARLDRSRIIHEGDHRFALLVEEDVLYYRFGTPSEMVEQLAYLLAVMALPSVSLGVIPRTAPRLMWPLETFSMFDDVQVEVELLTAQVNVTQPSEIAMYGRAFSELASMAVYGSNARALIAEALDSLG
ncbi:helix-turn-helix transcriptional regulator [Streptomyces sp. RCU064]|uniref:Helix-turn-helix transcriptional regulator n=1 Tax=Streptomyces rugosispiralis TaxID=2967341 RepID=A0ABT1UYZ7_9ACTN|nr:helix-turn-helix transcriptional regulator [Streptomyces rugosispiralis]